mmetsp:Transcript_12538/g.18936  ORF Transcript_12538/g.18936 Transcript_12538/m.18936 type:complete len:245 (+) Transcript_12538:114-848(+)|eukprot:CAMPEP_0185026888 /NCGR_PEP_ID=MMETSP1103-20130426/11457_1 /TAXON_ID=36769 /ORGANISM="Paraphysomonas bandaiensis, Strain Caron Lab Isolate" /LENGTH=244 /DNA_ID=CAMNT_0027560629 /DNA_START=61 /DNA_END=795 /DNA_ORIENTATION=-
MIDLTNRRMKAPLITGVGDANNACHMYNDVIIRAELYSEMMLHKAVKCESNHVTVIQDAFTLVAGSQVIVGTQAQKVLDEPNAGGTSVVSEALSAEYMVRRFGAQDIVTEMAIQYWFPNWKKIDYIATIFGGRVGISVTRAMGYPYASDFKMEDAVRLCQKKLNGLVVARAGISPAFSYERSILHCWCQTQEISNMMYIAFHEMIARDKIENSTCPTLVGSITLILTVCDTISGVYTEDFGCIV